MSATGLKTGTYEAVPAAVPPVVGPTDAEHLALDRTWRRKSGFVGWLTSTDHKEIGLRTVVTAFVFFLLGGVLATLMRLQLIAPQNTLVDPDLYDQLFTTHGTSMMFLFAVPVMEGMGIYFVPLMVGARNVAFPRLNAFGYWSYFIGVVLLYVSLFVNTGPDAGWFAYVPLADAVTIVAPDQVDMDMAVVVAVGPRAEHGGETAAGARAQGFAQRLVDLRVGQFDAGAIGKVERAHVDRIAMGVIAELGAGNTVAAAAFV